MKRRVFSLLTLCFLSIFCGCAGYHFNTNNNPLIGYDIRSLSVPMFVNRSNVSGISPLMTKEIILALNEYSGLKVVAGNDANADAVLLGIIESDDLTNQTFKTTENLFTNKNYKQAIGNREGFYFPVKTSYNFTLRVIFIKRPSAQELELLTSELGKNIIAHPKVVLQESIDVSGSFSRAVSDSLTATSGGETNFVKNKGLLNKSLQDVSVQAALTFKQVVLNAF